MCSSHRHVCIPQAIIINGMSHTLWSIRGLIRYTCGTPQIRHLERWHLSVRPRASLRLEQVRVLVVRKQDQDEVYLEEQLYRYDRELLPHHRFLNLFLTVCQACIFCPIEATICCFYGNTVVLH